MPTPIVVVEHFQPIVDDIGGEHVPLDHGVVVDACVDNKIVSLVAKAEVGVATHIVLDNFAAMMVVVDEIVHVVD